MSSSIIFPRGVFLFPGTAVKTIRKGKHYLADCGCCGGVHPYEFMGDCRDNANRYANDQDYADRNSVPVSDIVMIYLSEADAA
jgi:hypothetical protein